MNHLRNSRLQQRTFQTKASNQKAPLFLHFIIKLQKMFEQLKLLLQKQSLKNEQNQGRALDCLKQIDYFNQLNSHLGSDYLLALLPTLHPFVLREGFSLINQNDLYVHVEGDLRAQQPMFSGNRSVQSGRLIDLRDNHNLRYVAYNDCNMIRMQRSGGIMNQTQKKLQQIEREHNKKMKDYQKLITLPQNQVKLEIIQGSSFFSVLGQYDMFEFVMGCTFKQYSQYMVTHQKDEKFNKIGFIVSGRVKITLMNNKALRKDPGIYWFLNEGDWIGLEEHLWDKPQESSGEVQTIAAIILWIPFHLFQAKFNLRTNYQAINKLFGLIKTKRLLFERSLSCRKKNQVQVQQQHNCQLELNPQLQAKVEALQVQSVKKRSYFSRTRFQSTKKRQVSYPDQIMHTTQLASEQSNNLPRLSQRTIVLFPEEYAKSFVDPYHQNEMHRLKSIMKKSKSKQKYSTMDLNPEALYNTIYQKIAFKYQPKFTSRDHTRQRKMSEGKSLQHYNCSIYNNFKVGKPRADEQLQRNRTLTIMPSINT